MSGLGGDEGPGLVCSLGRFEARESERKRKEENHSLLGQLQRNKKETQPQNTTQLNQRNPPSWHSVSDFFVSNVCTPSIHRVFDTCTLLKKEKSIVTTTAAIAVKVPVREMSN